MKHKFSSMGRVAIALVLALSLVLMTGVPVSAAMGTITYTNLTSTGQRIVGDSDPTEILMFNIADDPTSDKLDKVRVGFESISGFFASDLDAVSVYSDGAEGAWDGDEILIDSSLTWDVLTATVVFDTAVTLTASADNFFFVVIETSADIADGDEFRANLSTAALHIDIDSGASYTWEGTATQTTYSITADTEDPEVSLVVGSTLGVDKVAVTFSEDVEAAGGWDSALGFIKTGPDTAHLVELDLTGASFGYDGVTSTLTITLDYDDDDYLINGDIVAVTPTLNAIKDLAGKSVPDEQMVSGPITGDGRAPRVAPEDIVGTINAGVADDTIVITFSEDVLAALDADWTDGDEIAQVRSGADAASLQALDLTDAVYVFTKATHLLTITLDSDHANLLDGNILAFTPATGAISDLAGNLMADTEVVGTTAIGGDTDTPGISAGSDWVLKVAGEALTTPVKDADALSITVTFDEDMADSPQVSIVDVDVVEILAATDMTMGTDRTEWSYSFDVPAGHDGTAIITASGTDLAGNELAGANLTTTFNIDNTAPSLAPTNITGETDGSDIIYIVFSEDTRGDWAAASADSIDKDDFASIETGGAALVLDNATFAYADATSTLTVTLNYTDDGAHLINGDIVAVTPATGALTDVAGNPMAVTEVMGTVPVTTAGAPVIAQTAIIGTTIEGADDTIAITFSEHVIPALDEDWTDGDEFTVIESPVGTGLDLTNAIFSYDSNTYTLTVALDYANNGDYLINSDYILVDPVENAITDLAGNAVPNAPVTGTVAVTGDIHAPTIDPGSIIGSIISGDDDDTVAITFSEHVVAAAPGWNDEVAIQQGPDVDNLTSLTITSMSYDSDTFTLTVTITDTSTPLTAGNILVVTPDTGAIEDLAGNAALDEPVEGTTAIGDATIELFAGWNLISLPLVPTVSDIETVLADITVVSVWSYEPTYLTDGIDNNEDGTIDEPVEGWLSYSSAPSDLDTMIDGKGYWINMNAADALVITGSELPPPPEVPHSYNVYEGWNLIGFKSLELDIEAKDYLDALELVVESMYSYSAADEVYTVIQTGGVNIYLVPGKGYWLAVSEDGVIYP